MRPRKLEIEGFTAFRQPICLDLSQLDLFAITGPTGAGKSSLIDAVCYALYGRVPRVNTEIGACISQGMERMQVGLEFAANGRCYRVFREARRKGAGNVRIEEMHPDGWLPLADRVKDVNQKVEEIIGLDYDGFTRSVLLPQGQFQEFLAGSAEKRRAVLRSLLRLEVYDAMRQRAAVMASELKLRIDERERTLSSLADATPDNLKRLETEQRDRQTQSQRLQHEICTLDNALALALDHGRAREDLRRHQEQARATCQQLQTTRDLADAGNAALDEAAERVRQLLEALAANCYDPERLTDLSVARERGRALQQARAGLDQATKAQTAAATALRYASAAADEAQRRLTGAEKALATADAALQEARMHDLAAALQQGLKPGDPCPVCGGTVGQISPVESPDLEAAQKRYDAARKTESQARLVLQTANDGASKAAAAAEAADRRLAELQAELEQRKGELWEVMPGDIEPTPAALEAALEEQTGARQARQMLEAQLKDETARSDALRSQLQEARQALALLEHEAAAAEKSLAEACKAVEEAQNHLATALASWPDVAASIEGDENPAALLRRRLESAQTAERAAVQAVGQLQARLERLKQDVETAQQLRTELAGLKSEHGVASDLAQMLMANRFQAFVQQEALSTLAADGSRRLEELSAGRYRLQVDDKGSDFEVIDQWNADQARSVRTLSGGETFLASLSLSLALAESLPALAASRRVVLDSVFLDEGFGSLDPEALDRAADALDALRSEDRMVCIVTHLPELAQRLPARVNVTKSETGSSVGVG